MPVGAVVFAEHWLFPRFGLARSRAEAEGALVNWRAAIVWAGTLTACYFMPLHLFYRWLPGYGIALTGYVLLGLRPGANMRKAALVLALVSLAACLGRRRLLRGLGEDAMKNLFLLSSVVWFAAASFWRARAPPGTPRRADGCPQMNGTRDLNRSHRRSEMRFEVPNRSSVAFTTRSTRIVATTWCLPRIATARSLELDLRESLEKPPTSASSPGGARNAVVQGVVLHSMSSAAFPGWRGCLLCRSSRISPARFRIPAHVSSNLRETWASLPRKRAGCPEGSGNP
jgi:hypothetical protein